MSYLVHLQSYFNALQRRLADIVAETFYRTPPGYLDGGFLADAVGLWDHEKGRVR